MLGQAKRVAATARGDPPEIFDAHIAFVGYTFTLDRSLGIKKLDTPPFLQVRICPTTPNLRLCQQPDS